MKRAVFLLLLPALLLLLPGRDAREAELLAPACALALDDTARGLQLTAELAADPAEDAEAGYLVASGENLQSVCYAAEGMLGGELYLAHAQVLLLDEQTARQEMDALCQTLLLQEETRPALRVAVCRSVSAAGVLRAPLAGEELPALTLSRLLAEGEKRGNGVDMPLYRLCRTQSGCMLLPALTLDRDGQVSPDGTAVLVEGRLRGYLTAQQTALYLLCTGKPRDITLTLQGTTLQILSVSRKRANGRLTLTVALRRDDGDAGRVLTDACADLRETLRRMGAQRLLPLSVEVTARHGERGKR